MVQEVEAHSWLTAGPLAEETVYPVMGAPLSAPALKVSSTNPSPTSPTRGADGGARESRFDDNYAFFRSQIRPGEAPALWRGLRRLEHVSITLGAGANAQQTFESLNSTGEPLRDHELIHNYVLMGLTHAEQTEIENDYWLSIEAASELVGEFKNGVFWVQLATVHDPAAVVPAIARTIGAQCSACTETIFGRARAVFQPICSISSNAFHIPTIPVPPPVGSATRASPFAAGAVPLGW